MSLPNMSEETILSAIKDTNDIDIITILNTKMLELQNQHHLMSLITESTQDNSNADIIFKSILRQLKNETTIYAYINYMIDEIANLNPPNPKYENNLLNLLQNSSDAYNLYRAPGSSWLKPVPSIATRLHQLKITKPGFPRYKSLYTRYLMLFKPLPILKTRETRKLNIPNITDHLCLESRKIKPNTKSKIAKPPRPRSTSCISNTRRLGQ